jgi:DnaK suppressor protein
LKIPLFWINFCLYLRKIKSAKICYFNINSNINLFNINLLKNMSKLTEKTKTITPTLVQNPVVDADKTRYSDEELKEFEELISKKVIQTKQDLYDLKETLSKRNDPGTDNTTGNSKVLEDGSDTLERENVNQLAARQQKFLIQLEHALIRIKNKTYGICIDSGKLIPKERLRIVPHTQHSIEAKMNKK